MTTQEYLIGWGIYLAGAGGAFIVWWAITRKIPNRLWRDLSRLIPAVMLVTPYAVGPDIPYLAPAIMMTLVDGLLIEEASFARAGVPLLIAVLVAVALYFGVKWLWRRIRPQSDVADGDPELAAAHDELLNQSRAAGASRSRAS